MDFPRVYSEVVVCHERVVRFNFQLGVAGESLGTTMASPKKMAKSIRSM